MINQTIESDMSLIEAGNLELARELLDLSVNYSKTDHHIKTAEAMQKISGLELHQCWKYVLTVSNQKAWAGKQ
tara:strand:+ start:53 stop:271 length:219 start_codon:yes stop_codon:yes gene_type:complete